jgi:hypothetical protein
MRKKWIYFAPLIVLLFIGFVALGGQVVKELWNWLMPNLFGLKPLTFWQALGLLALSRILVGGFGLGGGRHSRRDMSPEERQKMRQRFWGCVPKEAKADESAG